MGNMYVLGKGTGLEQKLWATNKHYYRQQIESQKGMGNVLVYPAHECEVGCWIERTTGLTNK